MLNAINIPKPDISYHFKFECCYRYEILKNKNCVPGSYTRKKCALIFLSSSEEIGSNLLQRVPKDGV